MENYLKIKEKIQRYISNLFPKKSCQHGNSKLTTYSVRNI